MEVHVKKLGLGDIDQFAALINVFEEVFEMENLLGLGPGYLENLLRKESSLGLVHISGEPLRGAFVLVVRRLDARTPRFQRMTSVRISQRVNHARRKNSFIARIRLCANSRNDVVGH